MRIHDLIAVLDGTHSRAPVPEVQMVPIAGLTAVMSAAARPILRLPQSRRDHLLETANRLRLQEACLPLATLLPAKAGDALSHDGAARFLLANQPALARLMQLHAGQVQIQITVNWDESQVLTRFRTSPEISPLFADQKTTPQKLGAAVAQLGQRLAQDISLILEPVSTEIATLPLAPGIVWNAALLLPHSRLEALSAAVEAVDAIWSDGFRIRQIGPAPIGSFVSLGLTPISGREAVRILEKFGSSVGSTRRASLMRAAQDGTLRDTIRAEALIAEAAARLPDPEAGFSLIRQHGEGGFVGSPQQEVA
jgi:hypothetical protein